MASWLWVLVWQLLLLSTSYPQQKWHVTGSTPARAWLCPLSGGPGPPRVRALGWWHHWGGWWGQRLHL